MPTYDYICQACDHALEIFQSMSEGPKRKCPKCGKLKLQRQIGMGAGILFKGSGFYETDYRSDSYSKGEKAASEAKKAKSETKDSKDAKDAKDSKDSKPAKTEKAKAKPTDKGKKTDE